MMCYPCPVSFRSRYRGGSTVLPVLLLVSFKQHRCDVLDRFIGMFSDVEFTERAGADDNISPGLFDLLAPSAAERCCLFWVPPWTTRFGKSTAIKYLDKNSLLGLIKCILRMLRR